MKKISYLLLVWLFLVGGNVVAQSLAEIQSIKVDNLSDAQIEQLIKRAEGQGLNEQQMLTLAAERGMPAGEVSKLRQRLNALKSGGGKGSAASAKSESTSNQLRTINDQEELEDTFDLLRKSDPYYDLTPTQKKIFGFKLFHNKNLTFNPSLNIPTPPGYTLGPGDQLLIDVYGASQQSYDETINPDGKIFIPNVGPIQVGGATVQAAVVRIKTALSRIYSGMGASNPNTFLDVRLGNIRTVSVALVGELIRPGTYTIPSFASPFNVLFAAGGINENGSFRHVQIYRDNKLLKEIDVYDFLLRGEFTSPVVLKDNDVIIVPPVRNRVEIVGPVRREGLFEVKQGETMAAVLNFAGGFTSLAYQERVTVSRKTGKDLRIEDVDQVNFSSFFPQDGDEIRIGLIQNRFDNRVQISGAVQRPGTFSLVEGMGLRELIEKANGLREDAFLNRATLYRTKTDFSLEIMGVDIVGIVDSRLPDIALQKEDVLHIPSIFDLKEEFYVKITGEVNKPGTYLYGEQMTIRDLVLKAGGFKESATGSKMEIARRVKNDVSGKLAEIIVLDIDKNLKIGASNAAEVLQPFDHVMVRRSPGFQRAQLVSVDGEAMYPGEFAIAHANERISDLLKRAGGLTPYAYPKGATLIRRNEFYQLPNDDEIKFESLKNLKEIFQKDSVDWSEAERILMRGIDKKLLEKEQEEQKEIKKNGALAENLRKESLMSLVDSDENSKSLEIKDVELIGIDLQGILRNPYGPLDLILKEGDVLSIPKELQTVRMRGEVLFPTTARFDALRGFRSYISKSGGFTDKARKSRAYVVYSNGDVKRTNRVLFFNIYPEIEPGAEIIVPARPERERMSTQAWIGVTSSLATLALIINQLLQ